MALSDNHITDFNTFQYGKNFDIGHYNHIGNNVVIGDNVKIGHHCIIDDDVQIGDDVCIENYVLLKKKTKIMRRTFIDSYVRSSGDNFIGESCTLRYGSTIAKKVVLKNNVFISPNVMTIYSTHEGQFVQQTLIEPKAFIGTAAVLGPGVTIGSEVVIGAIAYVSSDCIEKGIYVGVPAKFLKSL